MKQKLLFMISLLALFACGQKSKTNGKTVATDSISNNTVYLLAGTYTSGESRGIYVYRFDTVTADAEFVSMAEITNPSYLAVGKDEKFVYSVCETRDGNASASAFAFDRQKGELTFLNASKTQGGDPCHITVDEAGKHVVTASYSGGSISVFDVNADGSLSELKQIFKFSGKGKDPDRQASPHLHWVGFSPDGKYLYATDLGTDRIYKYAVDNETGENKKYLTPGNPAFFQLTAGAGPRHIAFHPNGKFLYLISELSGEVFAFNYDGNTGDLQEFQSIKADTLDAHGSADIHITPDGRFLYASNRLKGDGIAVFSINGEDGKLTRTGYRETGVHPRNFVITPDGKLLLVACRDSDVIQIFRIDRETGLPENLNKDIKSDMPVCLKFIGFP
jgi:6-phosphogluconolactonase (cycloisomerase 2 family)